MKRVIIIALVLLVAMPALAVDMKKKTGAGGQAQGNKAGLEQAAKALFEAVKANSTEKIKGYYTPDYTFTGPDGKMVSGEERLKMMAAGNTPTLVSYSDLNVRTYGSTGVVTGIAMTMNSSCGTDKGRFTQTWTWQKGRWWLAASQLTRITQ